MMSMEEFKSLASGSGLRIIHQGEAKRYALVELAKPH
jgi:hypothetical protein